LGRAGYRAGRRREKIRLINIKWRVAPKNQKMQLHLQGEGRGGGRQGRGKRFPSVSALKNLSAVKRVRGYHGGRFYKNASYPVGSHNHPSGKPPARSGDAGGSKARG